MAATDDSDRTEGERTRERRFDGLPSRAVVTAVAETTGQSPSDLPPLYGAIDPDALNALLEGGHPDSSLSVTFRYRGYRVTVTSDSVRLCRHERDRSER